MGGFDIDITKNIKTMELYKNSLLKNVAALFESLSDTSTSQERCDILADILMLDYLLAEKLGISYNNLDTRVINKLRASMLHEDTEEDFSAELAALMRHIDKTRDLK